MNFPPTSWGYLSTFLAVGHRTRAPFMKGALTVARATIMGARPPSSLEEALKKCFTASPSIEYSSRVTAVGMTSQERSGFLPVSDGKLYFEGSGQGPAIVFIHAAIADRRMWNREFAEYGRDHTVIRYDVRGFGRSTAATAPYSDVEDLLAVMDAMGIGRATVIGCSNGGRIGLDFALTHPDRVDRLVLVSSGVGGLELSGDPAEKAAFQEEDDRMGPIQAAYKSGNREAALDGVRKFWCAAQNGPALDLVITMLRDNLDEIFTDASASHSTRLDPPAAKRLSSIRSPTLYLLGDRDAPGMRFIANRATAAIPGAVLKMIPGADHLINLSRPAQFDSAVREFLAQPARR